MTYNQAMETILRMINREKISSSEIEALNMAIGALKTLEDMQNVTIIPHKIDPLLRHEKPLLVAINYTQDGGRTIDALQYRTYYNEQDYQSTVDYYSQCNDELYAVDFNANYIPFIVEIVANSTRLS